MIAKLFGRLWAALSCLTCLMLLWSPAQAAPIRVTITVDNSYALFVGTETEAATYVGSDFTWTGAETYNFDLGDDQYLYLVTASDLTTAQGFLGQFENLLTGYKFYSNDPQWQVAATGLGSDAPYSGDADDLALLSAEIVKANGGADASGGWTGLTDGPANGAAPWGKIAGIDAAARWVWYSSNGDTDPTTPGYDHDEWLIFRIPVAATPTSSVPEPAGLALVLSGLMIAGGIRRARG